MGLPKHAILPAIFISASELRNELPHVLARVAFHGQEYIITKHGQPYARLSPPPRSNLELSTVESIKPGFYLHYKNNPYEVIGVGEHVDTKAFFVIYRRLYGERPRKSESQYFLRPLKKFMGKVSGTKTPRFTRITDSATIRGLEIIRNKLYAAQ